MHNCSSRMIICLDFCPEVLTDQKKVSIFYQNITYELSSVSLIFLPDVAQAQGKCMSYKTSTNFFL